MDDCSNELYDDEAQTEMGQSDSKGSKKGAKGSKGLATSFGFRRRPASSSRADDRPPYDDNGNGGHGGSTEDLYAEGDVLSGRSTPLARPRKDAGGGQLRTNRFGFRQSSSNKTARVGDVSAAAEEAFSVNKDKLSKYNNNASDISSTNRGVPPVATQTYSAAPATLVGASGVPKTFTKQTVILTYTTQQQVSQPYQDAHRGSNPRSRSASRAPEPGGGGGGAGGRFTLHSSQLPRPQYPAVRHLDTKLAKQVANNSRKISGSSDGSREGSATDSGVSTGGDYGGDSPRAPRRPRNLEMVMKNAHSFHLRELNDPDLEMMDEAVITDIAVIPLPKLPIQYDDEPAPDRSYPVPPALLVRPPAAGRAPLAVDECSPVSTLERYRTRGRQRPSIINRDWNEEKFVLDRAQPEKLDKQNSFVKSAGPDSPTVSSKESSPSAQSDAAPETWHNHAAGEAMATRSHDDVSAYSTSSMEEDRSKKESPAPPVPQKTIVIAEGPAPHPLLMKSFNSSQQDAIRSIMINSMSSSNYSGISVSTSSSDAQNQTLTCGENNFEIAALEASTQSLLDDETSPADSLISTSNSNSNNDLANIDREVGSLSSSAYQTANTKTKSSDLKINEDELDEVEIPKDIEKADNKMASPMSPGSPTHASGSLSLSDGRDFFDDEIADQPGLLSMLRKNNEGSPASRGNPSETEGLKSLCKSKERVPNSPMSQRNRKAPRGGAERTPSLDTLSSLASDDMMMDNELGLSVTSLHSVDDYIERLDSSFRSGLNMLSEHQLRAELTSSKLCAVQQWNQLLEQNSVLDKQLAAALPVRMNSSCASLSEIQASLPVRTARLLQRSRAHTPGSDTGGTSGTDSPATPAAPAPPATATLLQDVVDIKTLLLQLKRVLHEPGEELHTMSSETLDPLLTACATPARGNGRRLPTASPPADLTADLRRQILYLQSQVEERDRLVRMLQQQMSKMADTPPQTHAALDDTCNVATQTDRLRPPIATNLSNTENTGLVSWSEQNGRRITTYSEAQKTRKPNTAPLKCQCGRKLNGITNGVEPEAFDRREPLQLKPTSRVGSRYLQAVSGKDYHKRDLSVNERLLRKNSLYASRSIENFHNQNLTIKKPERHFEPQIKHCTSYGDLYGSAKSNGPSPIQTSPSTDTDYSSDGGYKSLPSSINCNGNAKKVSGIPRRSIERRLFSSKPSVKASAI